MKKDAPKYFSLDDYNNMRWVEVDESGSWLVYFNDNKIRMYSPDNCRKGIYDKVVHDIHMYLDKAVKLLDESIKVKEAELADFIRSSQDEEEEENTESAYDRACEFLIEVEESALCPDGFEDAVIGVTYLWNKGHVFALSTHKCLDILMNRDGMSMEEAQEYFSFNIAGAYMGDNTPIFIDSLIYEE